MATRTAPKKKTAPSKKAAPKKVPTAKAVRKTKQPSTPPSKEAPQAEALVDDCSKGGAHDWTDDDTGRFCSKCLEPATTKKNAKAPAKKGDAAKDAAPTAGAAPKKKGKSDKPTGIAPQSQLDLEETKKLEAARTKKLAAKTPAVKSKAKEPMGERKMSALDAAAKILTENGQAMATKEMIDAMAVKGYWTSPGGKTPHATLYSAILREIGTKGKDARFQKVERGKFMMVK